MWYTFELIPHWFEGSVSVLCKLEMYVYTFGLRPIQAKHTHSVRIYHNIFNLCLYT